MNLRSAQASRLLIIGAGDVAWRALPWLRQRFRVFVLCRSEETAARWRQGGALPILGDLDQPATLSRLRGLATAVLHTAPPPAQGVSDPRTRHLLAQLRAARIIPRRLVYISTTGVYGDCRGAWIDETRPCRAGNPRAVRRVAAEQALRAWVRDQACRKDAGRPSAPALNLLRAPGIYASDRLPTARLAAGTPAIQADQDGYTNHIHAEDLARACQLALFRTRGGRTFNICDDSQLLMGDWFDKVALTFGLPRPERIPRSEAAIRLPASLLGFMQESRRLHNQRMQRELRLRLRYRTVEEGLAAALSAARRAPAIPASADAPSG